MNQFTAQRKEAFASNYKNWMKKNSRINPNIFEIKSASGFNLSNLKDGMAAGFTHSTTVKTISALALTIGESRIALEIDYTDMIFEASPIQELPNTSPYLKGIVNVYGELLPCLDLSAVLDIDLPNEAKYMAAVELNNKRFVFEFDETDGIKKFRNDCLINSNQNSNLILNVKYLTDGKLYSKIDCNALEKRLKDILF